MAAKQPREGLDAGHRALPAHFKRRDPDGSLVRFRSERLCPGSTLRVGTQRHIARMWFDKRRWHPRSPSLGERIAAGAWLSVFDPLLTLRARLSRLSRMVWTTRWATCRTTTLVVTGAATILLLTACEQPLDEAPGQPNLDLWAVTRRTSTQPAPQTYRTCRPLSYFGPFQMFLGPERVTTACTPEKSLKFSDGRTRTTQTCVTRAGGQTWVSESMKEATADGGLIHSQTASGVSPRRSSSDIPAWTDITEERVGACPPGWDPTRPLVR